MFGNFMVLKMKFVDLLGSPKYYSKIYVIKSKGLPVYVGLADRQCVSDRLIRHIGSYYSGKRPSRLSELLHLNHPNYLRWDVEVYSLEDASELTSEAYDCLACAERGLYRYFKELGAQALNGNAMTPSFQCSKKLANLK